MWGRMVRKRSPKSLCDEAELVIEKYKPNILHFSSDTFTVDKKWVLSFCGEIKKRGIDVPWVVGSRVDTVDYDMLKHMKVAGCVWLGLGVESGSQKILDFYNKGTTVEKIKQCMKWCNELGILTMANVMFGAPIETRETMEETIKLIKETKPDVVSPYFTNPICGTHLYDYAVERGLLQTDDYEKLSRHNKNNMKLENVTYDELQIYRDRLLREYLKMKLTYFINPMAMIRKKYFLKMILKRIWSLRKTKYDAYKKSYVMLKTYHKNPISKIFEMFIKGF